MTFDEIVADITEDMSLTSSVSIARVGRAVNRRYREVLASIGLTTSTRATAAVQATVGSKFLVFPTAIKVRSVFDNSAQVVTSVTSASTTATVTTPVAHGWTTGASVVITGASQSAYNGNYSITVTSLTTFTYTFAGSITSPATGTIIAGLASPGRVLDEVRPDQLRNMALRSDPPTLFAISRVGAGDVTIEINSIPATRFVLSADIDESTSVLSSTAQPSFPANYHDILVAGGKVAEWYKQEKPTLARENEMEFQRRLSQLRMYLAVASNRPLYQGQTGDSQ